MASADRQVSQTSATFSDEPTSEGDEQDFDEDMVRSLPPLASTTRSTFSFGVYFMSKTWSHIFQRALVTFRIGRRTRRTMGPRTEWTRTKSRTSPQPTSFAHGCSTSRRSTPSYRCIMCGKEMHLVLTLVLGGMDRVRGSGGRYHDPTFVVDSCWNGSYSPTTLHLGQGTPSRTVRFRLPALSPLSITPMYHPLLLSLVPSRAMLTAECQFFRLFADSALTLVSR